MNSLNKTREAYVRKYRIIAVVAIITVIFFLAYVLTDVKTLVIVGMTTIIVISLITYIVYRHVVKKQEKEQEKEQEIFFNKNSSAILAERVLLEDELKKISFKKGSIGSSKKIYHDSQVKNIEEKIGFINMLDEKFS